MLKYLPIIPICYMCTVIYYIHKSIVCLLSLHAHHKGIKINKVSWRRLVNSWSGWLVSRVELSGVVLPA